MCRPFVADIALNIELARGDQEGRHSLLCSRLHPDYGTFELASVSGRGNDKIEAFGRDVFCQ